MEASLCYSLSILIIILYSFPHLGHKKDLCDEKIFYFELLDISNNDSTFTSSFMFSFYLIYHSTYTLFI